jgi:hypothetical protein
VTRGRLWCVFQGIEQCQPPTLTVPSGSDSISWASSPPKASSPTAICASLSSKRNNTGLTCEAITLRYQRGLFLPEPGAGSLEKMAQDQKDDEPFLIMHAHLEKQGRHVSDKSAANNYAPMVFSKDPRANGVRP